MTDAELADTSDPRFTDDQRATLARFEAAPTPPEIVEARVVEEVARALHGVEMIAAHWDELREIHQTRYRRLAAAAVAAYRAAQDGGAEEAREVGLIAVRQMAFDWYCPSNERLPRVNCRECIAEVALDAALAPQAGDGTR